MRPDAIPCIPLLHVAFASLPAIYFFSLSSLLVLLLNPGQLLLPEHLGRHAAFLGSQHSPELQATPIGEGGGEVVPHRKTFAD